MRWILFALLVFFTSCDSEHIESDSLQDDGVWICHNPDTSNHNKICSEECLIPGVNTTYCWVLDAEQCDPLSAPDWLLNLCAEHNVL